MINRFRSEMPMPFVGVGHSMGGCQLANLALIHPRLFSALVLLDPVIQENPTSGDGFELVVQTGYLPARMSTYRRDMWPSRAEAKAAFLKTAFYRAWDPRVFEAWLQHGLRDTPTALYPNEKGKVTLTTTTHNEVTSFLRPVINPEETSYDIPADYRERHERAPFYRPEIPGVFYRLPFLRPSTMYVFGGTSSMSTPELQDKKLLNTGTGLGGSGGVKAGRAAKVSLDGIGHLVAMEAPKLCADAAAPWIGSALKIYEEEMAFYRKWTQRSELEKSTVPADWKKKIGPPLGKPPAKAKI